MIILSRIIFPVPCRNISFPHLDTESERLAVVEVRVEDFKREKAAAFQRGSRARWEACVSS